MQDLLIGCYELMSCESSRDYDAVGGVARQSGKGSGAGGYFAVDRNLRQSGLQERSSPGWNVDHYCQASLVMEYGNLPESDCGDANIALFQRSPDDVACSPSQFAVTCAIPNQDMGIKEEHRDRQ